MTSDSEHKLRNPCAKSFILIQKLDNKSDQVLILTHRTMRTDRNCRMLLFIAACLASISVQAAGPSVVSSTYTQKNLVFFDVGSELAVMTFDFDQDIYFQQKCPQRAQDLPIESTIILPCCNSTVTTNCVNTTTSISRCIDTATQFDEEFHFPGSSIDRFAYEFKVANPDTCHSVLMGSAMKYGKAIFKNSTS